MCNIDDQVILLFVTIIAVSAADDADWVDTHRLPFQFPVKGFYAGYLNLSDSKQIYYAYARSENNPTKDPLMVVIAPIPGCSSLHSFLYSGGQFTFVRADYSFRHNNHHNWNKEANVLYIEGPGGVGFSLGNDINITDQSLKDDYFNAILKFYQKFPELKDQQLYLFGRQYAGILLPKLALRIIQHNNNQSTASWEKINLGGLFLGNPYTLHEQYDPTFIFNHYTVKYMRQLFFISKEQYYEYQQSCLLRTPDCLRVEKKIEANFKLTGADYFNLYKECLHTGQYLCIDHVGIDQFLNLPEVQEDFNAEKLHYDLCNFSIVHSFQRDPAGVLKIYQTLLREEHNLRIWIVSGTQSIVVPTFSTKMWIEELKTNLRRPNDRLWSPWFYKNINAGQLQSFPGMNFFTIRSAGIDPFEDQPEIAHHLLSSFINNKEV